jgi:hypothetical protein
MVVILITLTYSCRWDTRRNYKYIEYDENNEIVQTEDFFVIADSIAYIKAFEIFSNSNSNNFELFNEKGNEISKKVNFVTRTTQEMKIKARILERRKNEEIASKYSKESKTVEKESSIQDEIKEQTVGIWRVSNEVLYRIRDDKQKGLLLGIISPNEMNLPARREESIRKEVKAGQTRFIPIDFFLDYYVLEKNGDLSAYDNYGHIVTYKKIN